MNASMSPEVDETVEPLTTLVVLTRNVLARRILARPKAHTKGQYTLQALDVEGKVVADLDVLSDGRYSVCVGAGSHIVVPKKRANAERFHEQAAKLTRAEWVYNVGFEVAA